MLSFAMAIDQMTNNAVFNAAVCLIGIFILLVHIVNVLLKKNRRKDENTLLNFLIFTAIHFAIYFTYTMIKIPYKNPSNEFTMGFYTVFYICNNGISVFFASSRRLRA